MMVVENTIIDISTIILAMMSEIIVKNMSKTSLCETTIIISDMFEIDIFNDDMFVFF